MDNPAYIYSPERVRRIRLALGAAGSGGVITGVIAILIAGQVNEDGAGTYAVILGIVSAGSIGWAVISWRLLDAPTSTSKRAVIITGVLLILFALPTFQVLVGLVFAVLGLLLIFLAVTDEGAGR